MATDQLGVLRWHWKPCNIYKDEGILEYNYNHDLENFKLYNN